MVQPWVSPLAPSLSTCSWKILKSRPTVLPPPHSYSSGMWMTPLSISRQVIVLSSSSISTHWTHRSSSIWKTPKKMAPYLSWTSFFPQDSTTPHTSVYRKYTHTDQYLHWDSNHNLAAKHIVYNTLAHRARVVCTSQIALKQEKNHIRQAPLKCSYPPWVLNTLHTKINHRFSTYRDQRKDNTMTTTAENQKHLSSGALH